MLGLSRAALSKDLGVSTTGIQKWENGLSNPKLLHATKLARILKIDLQVLMSGSGLSYSPDRPQALLLPKETASAVSQNITNIRQVGLDADLFSLINGAIQEYRFKNKEKYLRGIDAGIAMTLQVIYRELKRAPAREEILNLIEALQIVGKVYPRGVPLTPVESAQLLAWGSVKAPPIDHEIVCWEPEETPSNDR